MSKRGFGSVRQLKSKRWQARYRGPDGHEHTARTDAGGPLTFSTKQAADRWLTRTDAAIQAGTWTSPDAPRAAPPVTLRAYSATWLATRQSRGRPLSPTTLSLYRRTLALHILPAFGDHQLPEITPVMVRTWHAEMETGPRQRAASYSLLRTILNTAVADDVIAANPCRVRGAGQVQRAGETTPATVAELAAIAEAMPERYRLMVLLAGWCAMRFGELAALERGDIDLTAGVVHVRRGLVTIDHAPGRPNVDTKDPKSAAGRRDVAIPAALLPAVRAHLARHVGTGARALMFPAASGKYLAHSTLYRSFYLARAAAGRPDLRFHDLRHTGAVLAATTGATLADLMARLGHSTVSAAMRYQHAAADRDQAIAAALSEMMTATVTPIGKTTRRRRSAS